jgi:hypothetical protein
VDSFKQQKLLDLFFIACEVVELAESFSNSQEFSYSPQYETRMTMLAVYVVLRIARSPLKDLLPPNKAERLVFSAIEISKKRTVQDNDLDARNAVILTKIWISESVFIRSDGANDSLRLDLRNRMVCLSVLSVLGYINSH